MYPSHRRLHGSRGPIAASLLANLTRCQTVQRKAQAGPLLHVLVKSEVAGALYSSTARRGAVAEGTLQTGRILG